MFHKGKLIVFVGSALIVLYGVSAAFYGKVVAKDDAYKELSVFIDALNKINADYVEPPDLDKVQEGALRGLIESLDPYSSFLTKDQIDGIEKRKAAGKAGIGVAGRLKRYSPAFKRRAAPLRIRKRRKGSPLRRTPADSRSLAILPLEAPRGISTKTSAVGAP